MKQRTMALAVAMVLTGCAPRAVDHEAELSALRAAATDYHSAAIAKDANRVVGLYDAAAVMVPPNSEMVEDSAGVAGYRFGFIETPGVELEFEIVSAEVSESGDLGWTLSIGQITINRPDGPPGRDVVRDFHAWRKQADGTWKVVVDIWNSGLPADLDLSPPTAPSTP